MTRYVVVNGIGSNEIIYSGCDEDAAIKALGEGGREMYEISLNKVSKHGLFIERSIFLSGDKNLVGDIKIHKKVLDALLENFTPDKDGGESEVITRGMDLNSRFL